MIRSHKRQLNRLNGGFSIVESMVSMSIFIIISVALYTACAVVGTMQAKSQAVTYINATSDSIITCYNASLDSYNNGVIIGENDEYTLVTYFENYLHAIGSYENNDGTYSFTNESKSIEITCTLEGDYLIIYGYYNGGMVYEYSTK